MKNSLRKLFWCCRFFTEISVSKMYVKIYFRIIMQSHSFYSRLDSRVHPDSVGVEIKLLVE